MTDATTEPKARRAERNRYFHGRFMTAKDFRRDQDYFLRVDRSHVAELHGWGIVRGLEVTRAGGDALVVSPGLAIDALGRTLNLEHALPLSLERGPGDDELLVTAEYVEGNEDPSRAYVGLGNDDEFSVTVERCVVAIVRTNDASATALRLARVARTSGNVEIDSTPRRPLRGPGPAVTATSWTHGGTLTLDALSRTGHRITIDFSDALASAPAEACGVGFGPRTCRATCEDTHGHVRRLDVGHELDADRLRATLILDAERLASAVPPGGELWIDVRLLCDALLDEQGHAVHASRAGGMLPTRGSTPGGVFASWFRIVDSLPRRDDHPQMALPPEPEPDPNPDPKPDPAPDAGPDDTGTHRRRGRRKAK